MMGNTRALSNKAALWDKVTTIPRVDRYPTDPHFLWQTMEGEILRLQEMQTSHLWNSLKMIWNHRVAAPFKIIPYKPYKGIDKWHPTRVKWTVANLLNELLNRQDRTPFMNECLRKMAEYILQWKNEKIKDTSRNPQTLTLEAPTEKDF